MNKEGDGTGGEVGREREGGAHPQAPGSGKASWSQGSPEARAEGQVALEKEGKAFQAARTAHAKAQGQEHVEQWERYFEQPRYRRGPW